MKSTAGAAELSAFCAEAHAASPLSSGGRHRQAQRTEQTGARTELGRNDITARIRQYFAAVYVAAQPIQHARAHQGKKALLAHHAAPEDDSLRRDREHQLGAKLAQVIGLQLPLQVRGIQQLELAAAARDNCRSGGQALEAVSMKRADAR